MKYLRRILVAVVVAVVMQLGASDLNAYGCKHCHDFPTGSGA
jgi:hypothetical protein